jgi:hypothetical protein
MKREERSKTFKRILFGTKERESSSSNAANDSMSDERNGKA